MDANVKALRTELSAKLGLIPGAVEKLLTDPGTPPQVRSNTIRDLLDRFGLPAFRGTLVQSINHQVGVDELTQIRERLALEREEIQIQAEEIRKKLEAPSAANQEG